MIHNSVFFHDNNKRIIDLYKLTGLLKQRRQVIRNQAGIAHSWETDVPKRAGTSLVSHHYNI